MKHRTKQWLILMYTILTVVCTVQSLNGPSPLVPMLLAWPEVLTIVFIVAEGELTTLGMIITCAMCAAMLLHVAVPVCGFFRIYWPFKALLGVKAVLNLAAATLLPGWSAGWLVLLHGALFVLAMIFFRREGTEAASNGEHGTPVPEEKRLIPSPGMRMPGGGFMVH